MLFNVALFSSLLLVPAVLAVPSALGARIARRAEVRQAQVNNHIEQPAASGAVYNTEYSTNWAGAVLVKGNVRSILGYSVISVELVFIQQRTFTFVTGTFTVPTPSGSTGAATAAWVGIDGDSCPSAILQTGISFTVESGQTTYEGKETLVDPFATRLTVPLTHSLVRVVSRSFLRFHRHHPLWWRRRHTHRHRVLLDVRHCQDRKSDQRPDGV
jgi:hypothetical protein